MYDGRRNWSPDRWRTPVRAGAVLLPLGTCTVLSMFRNQITATTSVLVLVLIVVGAAATGDRVAGLLAAVSAGVWFDFFLVSPFHTFTIDHTDDLATTALLVLISVAVTEIALWGRREQARASRRSGYLDGVLSAAQAVAEGDSRTSTVTEIVADQITEVLGADSARFVVGPVLDERVAIIGHDGVVTRNGHDVDVDRVGLPTTDYTAVPVRRGPDILGHFLLTTATHTAHPNREQRRVAVLLADQVAAVDVFH